MKDSATCYTKSMETLFTAILLSAFYGVAFYTTTHIAYRLAIVALPSYVSKILTALTLTHS